MIVPSFWQEQHHPQHPLFFNRFKSHRYVTNPIHKIHLLKKCKHIKKCIWKHNFLYLYVTNTSKCFFYDKKGKIATIQIRYTCWTEQNHIGFDTSKFYSSSPNLLLKNWTKARTFSESGRLLDTLSLFSKHLLPQAINFGKSCCMFNFPYVS